MRATRLARGITQEQLAETGNLDRTYPSLLERELRTPTQSSGRCRPGGNAACLAVERCRSMWAGEGIGPVHRDTMHRVGTVEPHRPNRECACVSLWNALIFDGRPTTKRNAELR